MKYREPPASPPVNEEADVAETPQRPGRRHFLGGVAAVAMGGGLAACALPPSRDSAVMGAAAGPQFDRALRSKVKTVVVIYAENRSFNNLFGDYPGVERPLSSVKPEEYRQRDRDGSTVLPQLPPVPGGWLLKDQTVDGVTYKAGVQFQTNLPNAPFALKGPNGEKLPLSLVTHDLWHVFYQNQMQINGGKNDMFVAWADSAGFTMGHYANASYDLRMWDLASEFVLCDNFFQGAFGGSFLNHHYLIAATPPVYANPAQSIAKFQIAETVSGRPDDPNLKPLAASPKSAMEGTPKFGPSALTPPENLPDGSTASYAVNTMMPPYAPTPYKVGADGVVDLTQESNAMVVPPQTHEHIGDKLNKRGVEWAWYAGAFQQTLDMHGKNTNDGTPLIPNFQYHHQPFNYYANLGPGTAARAKHLRDGGLGDDESTNRFLADARAGRLPAVTFYKPQGNLNMHAGYADVASGDRHIMHAVKVLRASPQWENMVVIVTVDENGGWWDHVAPPKGDRWGPGTRVPALVISPFAKKGYVDHTVYDTASILRLVTRVFDLETLDGIRARDAAMQARGQQVMGDLTNALDLSS
ncbi:acid phosphatase [Paraburkholderia dinghuensis]|uniref:phospholipase C n=1 Tax=Paraburkholderia dinghuensis TaxID=2305225 RepID=A0A3N6MSL9_9BURK|nr:acid phosphatase [Paraburkholderia dinghuensis]RQH06964.1 acid phosphatase [Paraburkholderia dinghuensis]